MTIKQQGGIFGRNPTFNDVDVEGTLTVDGNAVPDASTILVDNDIGVTVQGYDADTAKRDTAQTFTAKQDFIFAGGGNYVAQFQNTTAATPYAVSIKDAASGSNGYPLLIITNDAGNDTYFRVDSGTSPVTTNKNIKFLSSGLGIDFSVTSDGSGTATSEILSDYEQGTWTPSLGGDTTYTVQEGYYVKVGSLVNVKATILVNAIGTGSVNTISGLPYTNGGGIAACNVAYWGTIATAVNHLVGTVTADGTTIVMRGVTTAASTVSTITTFQNSTYVELTATYSTLT